MSKADVVMTPGEAAKHLDVSPSGLRRLATVYGQVHGELPKDASGTSRIWTMGAIQRLQSARALVAAGQARTIRDGLRAVAHGAEVIPDATLSLGQDGRILEALQVVATQLRAVQDTNGRLENEVLELRREVGELRALPPGDVATSERTGEQSSSRGDEDGVLVKLARRLERLLGRGR